MPGGVVPAPAAPTSERVFGHAVEHVIEREGGYVNDPNDRGGETAYGISRRFNPGAWKNGPPSEDDAKQIYRDRYWRAIHGAELPPKVAEVVFDAAVHSGPRRAIRFLQEAVGVEVDGKMNSETLAKAAQADPLQASVGVLEARKRFLVELAEKDPTQRKFLRGWMNRVNGLKAEIQDEAYLQKILP